MAGVALPAVPGPGRELEDYVAGLFQAAGYFVERGIHERASTDVLELDAVATSYDGAVPRSVLVEAKGGRWGFPDVFKVVGWMQYLGIPRGGFFVREVASRELRSVFPRIEPLGIAVVDLADFRNPSARFRAAGFGEIRDLLLTDLWRYSFWIERNLLEKLRARRRANPEAKGPNSVLAYHDLVNDHVFFVRDARERLRLLYDAYRDHPKLSSAVAAEISSGRFDAAVPVKSAALTEAMYEGKHAEVQASFYVEHRARLSILKTAVDLLCGGEVAHRRRFEELPATFGEGLRVLRERPSFRRYALLWQVFLWGFGGFYLADRVDEEFAWLSEQTGVPREEIGLGLRVFDDLFPLSEGSWLTPLRGTRLVIAKMVPMAFRGIGAVQRLRRLGLPSYEALGSADETARTLVRWHNSVVGVLRG